ncbi:MAG: arginine--tRNA ligase [Phycisphaerae bacterium]|nr:arginine--tRNA ligase [Phycisphaerae bacterium]
MNLRRTLETRLSRALSDAGADGPALVAPAGKPEFGDYQANGCMAAAKRAGGNPRQLAERVVAAADVADLAEPLEVAGPGFINITLRRDFLQQHLGEALSDERLAVPPAEAPQTVVVDYSGPNLAKEMHVGHLRSTIIGDALVRVSEFLGHNVIRQNHVGDWGTQFGMLTAYMDARDDDAGDGGHRIADMEAFYQAAKRRFDTDEAFADAARRSVVKLQGGDEHALSVWRDVVDQSLRHAQEVYDRLGVTLQREHVRGESAYNDDLPRVVADLDAAGLLSESQGAQCVFLDGFTNADGEPLPVIVRKSDGGYLYATTDLGALRYRARHLHADRILYVTDSRQALHFQQVFAVARAAGFVPEHVLLEHVPFGMMLGANRQPFRTRDGGTVKLTDLLDEAVRRARALVDEKNPNLDAPARDAVAEAVGIGAVKYADLCQNRTSDYVFAWDKLLSLEGNTAPYLQYAYARVRSIFRKGGGPEQIAADDEHRAAEIVLSEQAERTLAVTLVRLPETLETVARESMPNLLCAYLYGLAGAFMAFYETCPVLKADAAVRASRLGLCDLTARTLATGLDLLGIETLERM